MFTLIYLLNDYILVFFNLYIQTAEAQGRFIFYLYFLNQIDLIIFTSEFKRKVKEKPKKSNKLSKQYLFK